MATHDYIIDNASGASVRGDVNSVLEAIRTNNSSSTAPNPSYSYQWWADTTNNQLKIRNGSNTDWVVLSELDGTRLIEDGSATAPGLAFTDDTNTGIFSPANDALSIATGGVERVQLDGTETVFNDAGSDVNFRVESDTQTHCLFVDAGNNRVGVNASDPDQALDVRGTARIGPKSTSDAELQIGTGATGNRNAYIDLVGDTTYTDYGLRIIRGNGGANTNSNIRHRGSGSLVLQTQESTGDIQMYVGTSSKLAVHSDKVNISQDANFSGKVKTVDVTPAQGTGGFELRPGAASHLLSTETTTASDNVLQVFGTQGLVKVKGDGDLVNTNNSYSGASDSKLKENIVDASSQWDDIKGIQVRNYNFKADTGFPTHTQIGVVAQELETVCPGLVKESPDTDSDDNDLGTTTKSVAYSVLYMKAVKALQEAMTRIETLETKVAALEAAD